MTPRVIYWNNIPAPYMVDRFNEVARRGSLDFEAWFSARTEADRSWNVDEREWNFEYRFLPRVGSLALPTPLLRRGSPDLLVSLYGGPSYVLGWAIARARHIRTAFWAEVTFDRWVERRAWKEELKRRLFPRVDAVLTAGEAGRAFAMRYGTSPDRAIRLPHVIDVDHFAQALPGGAAHALRDHTRVELGLRGFVFVYVGRLWSGKGLDHLVDAFADVQRSLGDEVSLLVVGDGPDEDRLRARTGKEMLRNVVFAGFHQASELPRLYAASDAFVFPTLGDPYGLVLDEAMAAGLPVISTDAAGEIVDRIDDGVEGYVVPVTDIPALADRMRALAVNAPRARAMGARGAARMAGRTPAQWAEDFEAAVLTIIRR